MDLRNKWVLKFHEMSYNLYLLDLRKSSPGRSQLPFEKRFQNDDLVLIRSPLKPRQFWILGTITDVILGDDSVVRLARVRRGDGLEEIYSLKQLCPLELSLTPNDPKKSQTAHFGQHPSTIPTVDGNAEPAHSSFGSEDPIWLCPVYL